MQQSHSSHINSNVLLHWLSNLHRECLFWLADTLLECCPTSTQDIQNGLIYSVCMFYIYETHWDDKEKFIKKKKNDIIDHWQISYSHWNMIWDFWNQKYWIKQWSLNKTRTEIWTDIYHHNEADLSIIIISHHEVNSEFLPILMNKCSLRETQYLDHLLGFIRFQLELLYLIHY